MVILHENGCSNFIFIIEENGVNENFIFLLNKHFKVKLSHLYEKFSVRLISPVVLYERLVVLCLYTSHFKNYSSYFILPTFYFTYTIINKKYKMRIGRE